MTFIDGFLLTFLLLLFAAVLALGYQRNNGYIGSKPPKPTVSRQLEQCRYDLATAISARNTWMEVAKKHKATAEQLAAALENCNNG